MREQLWKAFFKTGLLVFLLSVAGTSVAATLSSIATSGQDQDIVVEAGLSVGGPATVGEHGSRQFYEEGLSTQTGSHKPGLPQNVSGFVSTLTGDLINFDFQPFEQNNILKFDTTLAATKTLTFVSPFGYRQLAIVLSAGSLSNTEVANVNYTIHYDGGGTQAGTVNVGDWGTAPVPAGTETMLNVGRINMSSTGAATNWNNQVPETDTTANRWSIEVAEITPNSTANILSIDFGPITLNGGPAGLNSGDDVSIFGLAGEAVPEPGTAAMFLVWLVIACCRSARW
jgi:hypothetical protein